MPRGDAIPAMPAAGKAGTVAANSSSLHETLTGYVPPRTPDHLKPFRQSGTGPVGAGSSHYAKGTPFQVSSEQRFGRANKYDESTATRFAEMREPVFQPKTRPYASELKEPLGKSMQYGFSLPEYMQAHEFRFGKSSADSEPVKAVMYPPEGAATVAVPRKEAGYQTQRGYDWAKVQIDPTEFRFGAVAKKDAEEVVNPTALVPLATVEQRRQVAGDVGKARVAGVAALNGSQQSFGSTRRRQEPTMAEVLMQTADTPADLGKSHTKSATLRKLREQDKAAQPLDDTRSFGMPSIRSDKAPPAIPSITGNTNFGNEPTANQLLFPAPDTSAAGKRVLADVDEADVLANRCKFGLSRADVEKAFRYAARTGSPVTAASFKRAVDELGM